MDYFDLSRLVSENFRAIREKKKISQEDIAARLDIATARVSEFESGKKNPTLKTIAKFANAIEIDVKDLFDFSKLHKSQEHFEKESLLKIHCNTLAKYDLVEVKHVINTTNVFLDYLNKK